MLREPLLLWLVVLAPGLSAQEQAEWKEFRSKPGGFVVLLPETPKELTIPIREGLNQTGFIVEKDRVALLVTYQVQKRKFEKKDVEPIKKIARERLAKIKSQILDERSISLGKYPGFELLLKTADGTYVRHRYYLVQRRLLQLTYGPKSDIEGLFDADGKRFFQSFKLTD
ncbi:MAG: hypothetical protein L0Z62_29545 [Gemmataceae bacterium]|nr:hypothetical protein [Gemmataceae bacterium]